MVETKRKGVLDRIARCLGLGLAANILYVLSSGPVLATAFWLREATQWNGFYTVIWVYASLFLAQRERGVGPG